MHLLVLVVFYLWISVLHATFSGICLYAFWGHKLMNKNRILPVLILAAFLGFLETYWIPVALYLGLSIHGAQEDILSFFEINREADMVRSLFPTVLSIGIWIIQGVLANVIGRKTYLRIIRKANHAH